MTWRRLLELLPVGTVVADQSGVIQYASQRIEILSGFGRDELLGQPLEILVLPTFRGGRTDTRSAVGPAQGEWSTGGTGGYELLNKDGDQLEITVDLTSVMVDNDAWVIAAIADESDQATRSLGTFEIVPNGVASRLAAAAVLASSEQRFRLAFEDNMSPMIFTDLQDRVIEANAAFCTLIGRTNEQILGVDSKPFTLPADIGITEAVHQQISSGEASQVKYVKRYLLSDGRIIVVEVAKSPARDAAGRTLHYVISERDITELTQRNHMQDLRSAVNKLTKEASSEERFLQRLAKVMNRVGGYALAFIGTPSHDEVGVVDIVCAEGVTEYLFESAQCWWELNARGRGPAGAALDTRVSQIANDLADGGPFEFWRARAVQFGFESHLAIPVTLEGRLGVLSLFDRHARTFNEGIAKELESIVNDAVIAVAHERSMDQTEAALAESVAANRALQETE